MALEEKSAVDKIEVLLSGHIQVRRRDQVLKDGVEIAATYHRHVLHPGLPSLQLWIYLPPFIE